MDDFKNITSDISQQMKKLVKMNEKALESIFDHEPEKVSQIIKDNKDLINALEKKDLKKIINIQQKYADYDNK